MSFLNWIRKLSASNQRRPIVNQKRKPAPRGILRLENLEDRITPAITILDGGVGTLDGLLSATDGTITAGESTGAQTLSRTAIQGVGAAITISISSDAITFNNLSTPLALLTGSGTTASFSAGAGAFIFNDITDSINTAGGNLSLTSGGNMTIGSLNTSGGNIVLNSSATFSQTGTVIGSAINITGTNGATVDSVRGTSVTINAANGAINSAGAASIQTSAQLTLNAKSGINVNTLAAQFAASNSTSGNISVNQSASPSQTLTLVSDVVNNAVGGTLTLVNNGEAIIVNSGVNVTTAGNGAITLSATDLTINGTINSGSGITTLSNSAAGVQIDLGSNTTGKLSLTQAELNNVLSTGVLRIGSATSGAFTITAAISANAPIARTALTLISGAAMTESSGTGTITSTNLRLSGTGPITLQNSNVVTNLVADLTGAGTGSLFYSNGVNPLTVGAAIDGVTGIATNNSDVTLVADTLDVANTVNAGTGIVTFQPFSVGTAMTVGTGATGLGISDTELGRVTAGVVRVGTTVNMGTITIDGGVSRHGGFNTLSLITGNATAGAISQTAALSVAKLNVETLGGNITLTNPANDVDSLAADSSTVAGTTASVITYTDANGFAVDTVDADTGLQTDTVAGSLITLTASGAVTQTMGSDITGQQLELLGSGPYTLNNAGNDVVQLAANLTTANAGTLSYTDADSLNIATAGGTNGVTTNNADINIATVDGDLTVFDTNATADVNAGTAIATLTAGSVGVADRTITLQANGTVVGTGGVALAADHMSIGASVNAGANTAVLKQFQDGTLIDLGGGDVAGTLGLTDAELDFVTAGVIQVGDANAGSITVTALIDTLLSNQLELVTGGAIRDGFGGIDIIEVRLALTAVTGIGTSGLDAPLLDTQVSRLEARTTGGGISIQNRGPLIIGNVNATLTGVTAGGGNIEIQATDPGATVADLTVSEAVSNTGGGNILLSNSDADSPVTILINAAVSATGGSGSVTINGQNNVTVNAAVSTVGSGAINLIANQPNLGTGNFSSNVNGTISSVGGIITVSGVATTIGGVISSTGGGSINLTAVTNDLNVNASVSASGGNGNVAMSAGGNVFVIAPVSVANNGQITANANVPGGGVGDFVNSGGGSLTSAGGDILIRAQDIDFGANVSTTSTAAGSDVFLLGRDLADLITLGGDTVGALGLTDADLDHVTAGVLNIGSAATNTAGFSIVGAISQAGSGYSTLSLETGTTGAITDNRAAAGADITVDNLALRAGAGIGSADTIELAISRLAFSNTNTGNVSLFNAGGLTIDAIDGLNSSSNSSTGATTTISAASPITFAVNTSSDGDAIYTAGEISDFGTCADDLTVNAGVTVSVIGAGNDLTLRAGDDVIINGTVNAANVLNITAGFGDLDGCGTFTINGSINGNVINLTSQESLCLPTLNLPASAINIVSIAGAIYDCDPAMADNIDITAASLTLKASTGIGITDGIGTGGAIETQVGAFEAETATGGIFLNNGFTTPTSLTIGGLSGTLSGVKVTSSGNIVLNNNGTIQALTTGDGIRTQSGSTTVTATGSTADLTIAVNSASGSSGGNVFLTAGRDIFLGDNGGNFGDIIGTNLNFMAGQDIVVNSNTDVLASGAGIVNATAVRNISLIQTGGVGSTINTSGGALNLNTGTGGIFTLDTGFASGLASSNGAINITADDVVIVSPSTINSGSGIITIKQATSGRQVDLGTNTFGKLSLTDTELDQISTTSVLRIGDVNTGAITVTAPITATSYGTLHLKSGSTVTDSGPGSLTVSKLAVEGNGVNLDSTTNNVGTLAGRATGVFTNAFNFVNAGNLAVGAVDSITGVATTNGGIGITTVAGSISVSTVGSDISATTGNITLLANGVTSDITLSNSDPSTIGASNGNVSLTAGRDILLGATQSGDIDAVGNIILNATRDIILSDFTFIDAAGAGNITGTAGRDITISTTNGPNSRFLTNGGTITLTTGMNGVLTVDSNDAGGAIRTTSSSGNGNITLNADHVNITASDSIRAGTGIVTIQQVSPAWNIDLGSLVDTTANTLELSDAELDRIFAGTIRIGDAANTGNITVTSQISPANSPILTLRTAGTIADGTGTEQADITVANLALLSATGSGTAGTGDIDVDVTTLAANNSTSGDIFVSDFNSMSIGTVDGVTGVTNQVPAGTVILEAGFGGSGTLTITDTAAAIDVGTASTGSIILRANDGVTVNAGAVVQSGVAGTGGTISVLSNFGDVSGTSDITIGTNSMILTNGDIVLNADPDGNCVGGDINIPSFTQLAGPGMGNFAQNVTLRTGTVDILLDTLTADNDISITTCGNLLDDSIDSTVVTAGHDLFLTAGGRMGGVTPLTTADILSASTSTPTTNYLAALDVAYGNNISLDQSGSLGNVQIRKVGSGLNTNSILYGPGSLVGTGNQLAFISAGGQLTVDNAFTTTNSNEDLFLSTVNGNNIVLNTAASVTNNGATATTTLIASGSTSASISGPVPDATADIAGTNIVLATSGGNIGTSAVAQLEINVSGSAGRFDGFTNGAVNNVASPGGSAFITDTVNGIRVGQFNAGTGDVNLISSGNVTPTGSSIVSVTPNDDVAEIIGNNVTLTATGVSTGSGGQIGFFSGTAQFFEVNANVLSAVTNNSRMWLSEVGTAGSAGTQIANVNVGTETAFLRVRNGGSLVSQTVEGTPDVVAATVNLSAPEGGNFGSSSPLEIDATTLVASVTGTGNVNVLDTAGGVTVQKVSTTTGTVTLNASGAGANMTLGNGSSTTPVIAASGAVALTAVGSIGSSAGAGISDVAGSSLSATAGTGVGTSGTPLETAVATLTASGGSGGVFVSNTGALAVGNVSATGAADITISTVDTAAAGEDLTVNTGATVGAGTGNIALQAADNLTVNGTVATTGAGVISLVGDFGNMDTGVGSIITLAANAAINSTTTAQLVGGSDPDTFNVFPQLTANGAALQVSGNAPTTAPGDVLRINLTGATGTVFTPGGVGAGGFTFTNRKAVDFTGIEALVRLPNNLLAIGAPVGTAANALLIDPTTGAQMLNVNPFPGFLGGVRVSVGDVNGDGVQDLIAAAGPGAGPHVKVFDGATGQERFSFFAFAATFTAGINVTSGDVNGDGFSDIIVAAGPGGGPHVKVFDGRTGAEIRSFFAYAANYSGGVNVASADLNNDGFADIITGSGLNASHVKVFDGRTGAETQSYFAYGPTFLGGVTVSTGDLDGDGNFEIITGAGPGGGPHVKVFNGQNGTELRSFFAYPSSFPGGVRVTSTDLNGDGKDEIVVSPTSSTAQPTVAFDFATLAPVNIVFGSGLALNPFLGN